MVLNSFIYTHEKKKSLNAPPKSCIIRQIDRSVVKVIYALRFPICLVTLNSFSPGNPIQDQTVSVPGFSLQSLVCLSHVNNFTTYLLHTYLGD